MPSYFTVLTPEVRYNPNLSASAKILYSEIKVLSNKNGYCWSTNAYLGNLFGVSKETVSRWISALVSAGYIKVANEWIADNGATKKQRKIIMGGIKGKKVDKRQPIYYARQELHNKTI